MTLVFFYIFLIFFTFLIFKNAYIMWKINKDFTLPISIFFIYYFTLGGALFFPLDSYLGFIGTSYGFHYLPIFDKLFVVNFDNDYILSCVYYVVFILVFQYSYLIIVKKLIRSDKINGNETNKLLFELTLNPFVVLLISLTFIAISFFILRKDIFYAISHEESIYLITRTTKNPYYTIHQLANEFSILIPFIAYSFIIIKSNKFNIKVANKCSTIFILLLTCTLASVYISFLGNRREILSAIVICILISINQFKNIYYSRFIYIFMIVLILFLSNDFVRSTYIPAKLNGMFHIKEQKDLILKPEEKKDLILKNNEKYSLKAIVGSFLFSNELFYAHFSMYGIINKNVPITYGSSFNNLVASVIPRAIYHDRPPDIYSYYVKSVNATPGQIYTIHHATAWYLNFGVIGIFLGAVLLALIFAFASYFSITTLKNNNVFFVLLKYLFPFLICAQIVTFITTGPEGYKSLLLEGIILPILFIRICFKKITLKNNEE